MQFADAVSQQLPAQASQSVPAWSYIPVQTVGAAWRQAVQLMQRLAAAAEGACREGGPRSNGAGPAAPLVLLAGDFNTTPDASACRVRAGGSWVCI